MQANQTSIITVHNLSREYKVAKRGGGMLKYVFSRQFDIVRAVNSINFSVRAGELVGFVGPNGAGKSTTIKMLTGILTPTAGEAKVLGRDPFKERKRNAVEIGAVFGQRSQLWWELPIADAFTLLRKIYRTPPDVYERNIALYKEYLDLDSIWSQPVRQLSLGQRMRAEVAAAILHNPRLLFLDEPTLGLDIVAKRQIREFILKLNRDHGTTVILTSHDMKDIEEICERIILIDKGAVVIDCPLDELKSRYNTTAVVTLTLNKPVAAFDIPGAKGTPELGGLKWSFAVDKNATTPGHVVFEISQTAEISDMEIKEQVVEDIIHDIYRNGL